MPRDLDKARNESFSSYNSDDARASIPVRLVPFEDSHAFITKTNSSKVWCVRNNPGVMLCFSNIRVRVRAGALVHDDVAELLSSEQSRGIGESKRERCPIGWLFAIQVGHNSATTSNGCFEGRHRQGSSFELRTVRCGVHSKINHSK
jgi:hypothetical protein